MSDPAQPEPSWVRLRDRPPTEALVVLVTAPDLAEAERIGRALVDEGLCACVNLIPGVQSIYRWQGQVETAGEILCVMKTSRDLYSALEERVRALHPYRVPEVLALPVEAGA